MVTSGDSYRELFSCLGIQLRQEDGCSVEEISRVEEKMEIKIPESLRNFFLIAGRENRVNQFHNRILFPEKWELDSGYLIFLEENQNVVYWGVPAIQKSAADAEVFHGVNLRDDGIEWHKEHDSCSTFLQVMIAWHASCGGAVDHTAVGYVDELVTRERLDGEWQLIGEVNAMRAYRRPNQLVCFLKWEDMVQKIRKISPWRVFAAAASSADLEETKQLLTATWEPWG